MNLSDNFTIYSEFIHYSFHHIFVNKKYRNFLITLLLCLIINSIKIYQYHFHSMSGYKNLSLN